MASENYRAPSVTQSAELAEQQREVIVHALADAYSAGAEGLQFGGLARLEALASALASTGKQQVVKKEHWLDRMAAIEGRIEPSAREMEGMDEEQVGAVQGDALYIEWLKERISSIYSTVSLGHQTGPYAYAGEDFSRYLTEAASDCRKIMRVLSALAAHQPVGYVPDGVWEALQRIIENSALHGPASNEDAILVARYRRHLLAAPPAQGIDLGQVREIHIPARNNLDPISVFVQDQAAGRGRIVVTCYGNAWQAFWGAMGNRTVMEFVAQCDADYVAGNMISGRQTRMTKAERAYTERIATEVIAEFRALRDGQRDAAPGVANA